MEKYPAYKDSGIDWLCEIPDHWNSLKINHFTQIVSDRNFPEEELLSVYRDFGVIKKSSRDDNHNKAGENLANYKLVKPGYLVLNKMKTWQGSLGLSEYRGIVSPAYITCKLTYKDIVPKFLHYALRCKNYVFEYNRISYGVRTDQWDMRYEDFKNIPVYFPPLPEQSAIANFLDHKTAQIDRFIQLKEKTIALLEERKAAIINQAVTKGLNPDVPMKDSGIEWLGEIPEHWEVSTVKRLAEIGYKKFTDGDWVESPFITKSGVRLIQTGNVGIGVYKEKGYRYISDKSFKDLNCTEIFPNDVLICRLDGPVGRACLVPELGVRMITSVDNAILKVNKNISAQFVVYLMSSNLWIDWIQSLCRAGGGFRFRISRSNLGFLQIPVPNLQEQKEIVTHLNKKTTGINNTIKLAKDEILLIKEYRESLISSAVTGKIDIRNHPYAQRHVPASNL